MSTSQSIHGASVVARKGVRIALIPRQADRSYEQKEADARLIAAAPDLLAALRYAVSEESGYACPASTEALLRAILKKARG